MKSSTAAYALTLLVVVSALAAIVTTGPPPVVPETAPAELFSGARALEHVRTIARKPHATGTEAHAEVRQYLIETLKGLGLEPQLQETSVAVEGWGGGPTVARVVNVLGRLVGREQSKAILFVSHYDSVPYSFGAADDGSGVAAMLETLRALRSGPQLRNDVIFLFADGEEAGLLGARAFAGRHPWIEDVGVVVNFEARGTRGPSLMFETSDGNARLIGELRSAMAHPRATSYSYEIYKLLPNDTDFSVFRRHGLPGMNFAFIHGGTAYHTLQDSIENLDPRSLQHHGEAALGLARRLGEADLTTSWATQNAVYFNLIGSWLVVYPGSWVWPLAILASLATLVMLVVGSRRGQLRAGRCALAVLVLLLVAVLFGGVCLLAAGSLFSFYNFSLWGGATSYSLTLLGLALVVSGLAIALARWLIAKLGAGNLTAAGWIVWLILTLAIAKLAPGADYLFVWPLLFGLLAAFIGGRQSEAEGSTSWAALAGLALLVVAATLLWAPTLALIGVALGGQAAPAVGLFVVLLLLGLLTPVLALAASWRPGWLVPVLLVAIGLGLVIAVGAGSTYGQRNRMMNSVSYVHDREQGSASWLSFDRALGPWVAQVLGESPQRSTPPAFLGRSPEVWRHEAPPSPHPGAILSVLGERVEENLRKVDFNVAWPYPVHRAIFQLSPRDRVLALKVEDRSIQLNASAEGPMTLSVFAPPQAGVRFSVELAGIEALTIDAVAQRYELPSFEGLSYPPRPATTMPRWGWTTDSTFIRDALVLAPGSPQAGTEGETSEPAAAVPAS